MMGVDAETRVVGSKNVGHKDDAMKDDWSLMLFTPLREVVRVLMHGAEKYGAGNWRLVPNGRERYFNAMMRHALAWHGGEQLDNQPGGSGLHHLAHATCCALFLMAFELEAKSNG